MAQDTFFSSKKILNIRGNAISLTTPLVMGILNITPDSFYASSRVNNESTWLDSAENMIAEGATILDIGGYSSRPGAENVTTDEELKRVLLAVSSVRKAFPDVYISIDTFRSEVAKQAVAHGADIINDISGGALDTAMFETVASLNVPYIMMHMRGTPQTMSKMAHYDNIILEIIDYFQKKVRILKKLGVKDLILDPGFGFAKSIGDNFKLVRRLKEFNILELPLLVGFSRKSMIYKSLNIDASRALNGTTVLNTMALMDGASILRVHDVKEAIETIKLFRLTNDG